MDRRNVEHDELAGDVPAYLLGALDAGNCEAVAEHLDDCPTCKEEGRRINEAIGTLGLLAPEAAPPADLRNRFLTSLQHEEPAVSKPRSIRTVTPRWMRFLMTAAAILLVALVGWNILLSRDLSQTRADLAAVQQHRTGLVMSGAARSIPLVPMASSNAAGTLYLSSDASYGLLAVEKLPPAKLGMVYEIWLIQGTAHAPLTVFHTNANGRMMVMLDAPEPLTSYQSLAITQEPGPSGSVAPTGTMLANAPLS